MRSLKHRVVTPEWMDREDVPEPALRRSLGFLRGVNRWLGGTRPVLRHLQQWSRHWRPEERIGILDIGTGSADIPLAILRWAKRVGFDVHVTGVDRHQRTLALAAEQAAGEPRLTLLRGDATALPFAAGSFDYCTASLFLHHLHDAQVELVLRQMDHIARRGLVCNDLLRHRGAYFWVSVLALNADAVVRHDGPASVAAGFRCSEMLALRDRLGLDYLQYRREFGLRFTLAGERAPPVL